MAKKVWIIELDDEKHKIELEHGYFLGKRMIYLDGKLIEYRGYSLADSGSKNYFNINSHQLIVLITCGFKFSYSFDLIIDGVSVETGLPVETENLYVYDNSLEFYIIMVSLILLFVIIFFNAKWYDNDILHDISSIIIFIIMGAIVYAAHFIEVKPFRYGIILSGTVTFLTAIIVIIYIKFIKTDTGFSPPIAFVSQAVISKYIKKALKIKDHENF